MLHHLPALIKKVGSPLSPEKFHERVNIVFHDFESAHYDNSHSGMRDSLQEQVDILINDLLKSTNTEYKNLKLLDIGCGTGLSTKLLIESKIGEKIEHVTLLDTSVNMLKEATKKAKGWDIPFDTVNGYLGDVVQNFDIIMICSVLHHIPDLATFLKDVSNRLNPNGVLIHLQDPNYDHLDTENYKYRKKEHELIRSKKTNTAITDFIPKDIKRKINTLLKRYDYIDHINNQLLSEKAISKRMTADEIWGVTDIHVETDEKTRGISLEYLKSQLTNFELINMRSYAFFEPLKSDLIESFVAREEKLIRENDKSGRNISCIWIKKNPV